MPTDRQFEAFLATIDCQSMRGAADRLGISQPSVSKHIHSLEQALGQRLFERSRGSRIALSEHGKALEQEIRELHARRERLLSLKAGIAAPRSIKLYMRHFLYTTIEERLLEFGKLCGDTEVLFEPVGSEMPIVETVGSDPAAAAFLRLTAIATDKDIETTLLAVDECALYAGADWLQSLGPGTDPFDEARILLPGSGELRDWIAQQLRCADVSEERIEHTSWHPAAVLKKVLSGHGVTVFLKKHVQAEVDAGRLAQLDLPLSPLFLQLVTNRQMHRETAKDLESRIRSLLL